MDINIARQNMLKQQIRASDVLDDNILDLFYSIPREAFVPTAYYHLAFADQAIPLGHNQVMMTPSVEAKIIQSLAIAPQDKILEVGTGSGYMTALLAMSGQYVYSLDVFPDFLEKAAKVLEQLGIDNVTLQEGNGALGWSKQQPYDVICMTGSLPVLPNTFRQQLTVGGRLFAIVGVEYPMRAVLIKRVTENEWQQEYLFETKISSLLNAPAGKKFVF